MAKRLSIEQIKLRIECLDAGLPYKEAARKCNCSPDGYSQWVSMYGRDKQYKEYYLNIETMTKKQSKLTNDDIKHYSHNTHKPLESCVSECKTIAVSKKKVEKLLAEVKQNNGHKPTVFVLNGKAIGNQVGRLIST